ncbi:ankyrin repeat domain-containing protein [Desulfuromonas acetoxidans]|uniref:ankyrin repeat domain-containing protein n=1 Tax=Desulfuromonas acetoxidans TaxID=891 RepID=UPI00293007A0|nr:ankyrin repeat domain-containing protein [Desulfuromonas acetoxidans]
MTANQCPPFATAVEVIRALANALNTKMSNKKIDDLAFKLDVDYRDIDQLIKDVIAEPISNQIDESISVFFEGKTCKLVHDYLAEVSSVSMDGVSRRDSIPLLLTEFFPRYVSELLHSLHGEIGGPSPASLLDSKESSISIVLQWFERHERGWNDFFRGCTKEQKDRIWAWKRGDDLPIIQSFDLMQSWSKKPLSEMVNWPRVNILLLLARALDWARNQELGPVFIEAVRAAVWAPTVESHLSRSAWLLQEQAAARFRDVFPLMDEIEHSLLRTSQKTFSDKGKTFNILRKARKMLSKLDPQATTEYWLDWHEARWNVFSGKLDRACEYYKKAFEGCLYRSGSHQKAVIEEGMIVAASLERADKVFLKRLKNMIITFGYDIPSVQTDVMCGKNTASDFIEEWEVDLWRAHFEQVFPADGFFHGANYPKNLMPRKGPLKVTDLDAIKPDYRHPNRKIRVGETWQKTLPQIVWFSEQEKTDVVKKLIEKGADVNVFSDSKDTPILMALRALNAFSPMSSMDDAVLKVLLQCDHEPETLNTCTSKKRLLPIISAIETGRIDVVQAILKMGADPNKRGQTDEQTPLNICLQRIAFLKLPKGGWKDPNKGPLSHRALDSLRRHSAGIAGFTLEDQKRFVENIQKAPISDQVMMAIQDFQIEKTVSHVTVDDLREIALLLLDSGANPNAEHSSPLQGYTPMMLAAELDEVEIFDSMLSHGGNPRKTYVHPHTGALIDCSQIARSFGAERVTLSLQNY